MQIRTPRGIRFDCSGCGNCCLQWPVPVTALDYERIRELSNGEAEFRKLKSTRENLYQFTHTLEKRADGRCQFLTAENRCQLHLDHGTSAKPSMCSLFPYTFMVTPDAVLASLSFASSAVLYNTGKLLSEQDTVLTEQLQRFQQAFTSTTERWQNLQLLDGTPLSWDAFSNLDKELMAIVNEGSELESSVPRKIRAKLAKMSKKVISVLPKGTNPERDPKLESRPKIVDQLLIKYLDLLYFPEDVFSEQSYDLKTRELMMALVAAPESVSFGGKDASKFSDLIKLKLGNLPEEVEELIDRFLYVKVFSKFYFGPGFHHLSLLAGIHHLQYVELLLRLKLKHAIACEGLIRPVPFDYAAELIRILERRITQLDLSKEAVSVLEILCSSPERASRIHFLAE